MRDADGVDTGRRAADAFADRQDCGRAGCAEKIYLPVHERAAAEREAGPFQAEQISDFFRAHGWAEGTSRFFGVPRRRVRAGG